MVWYARGNTSKGVPRNYTLESRKNVLKQLPLLEDIVFKYKPYLDLHIPEGSTVYCDPPYAKTTSYKTGDFDHTIFWNWVRDVSNHSTAFVSEYNAPDDFKCVWSKEVNNTLVKDTGSKKGIERLFTYKG